MTQLVSPQVIRNLGVVRASDIISGDIDSSAKIAALNAGLQAARGRVFLWNTPWGQSTKNYVFTDRTHSASTNVLTVAANTRVEADAGATIDTSAWANSGSAKRLFYASAATPTFQTLSASAYAGQNFVTLTSANAAALSLSAGDKVQAQSSQLFVDGGTVGAEEIGFILTVRSVSGGTVTFWETLPADLLTGSGAQIGKLDMLKRIRFSGLHLVGTGQFTTDILGDDAIYTVWTDGAVFEDITVERFDSSGIRVYGGMDTEIHNPKVLFDEKGTNTVNQYGVALINTSGRTLVKGARIWGGKHGVVQSESGTARGVTFESKIIDSWGFGQWNFTFAVHTNAQRMYMRDNISDGAFGGFEAGTPDTISENNLARNLQTGGTGFAMTDWLKKFVSRDDTVEGADFGMRLQTSAFPPIGSNGPYGFVDVKGFTADRCTQVGMRFDLGSETGEQIFIRNTTMRNMGEQRRRPDGTLSALSSPVGINIAGTALTKVVIQEAYLQGRTSIGTGCISTSGVDKLDVADVLYTNYNAPVLSGTNITQRNITAW